MLARTVQKIIDVDPAGARPWLIHSMAIAYRGRLVLDEYFTAMIETTRTTRAQPARPFPPSCSAP